MLFTQDSSDSPYIWGVEINRDGGWWRPWTVQLTAVRRSTGGEVGFGEFGSPSMRWQRPTYWSARRLAQRKMLIGTVDRPVRLTETPPRGGVSVP